MNRHDLIRRKLTIERWLLQFVGTALTLGLATVVATVVFLPVHARSRTISSECAELDKLLQSAPDVRAKNKDLRRQIDEAEARNSRLAARVPGTPHEADFLGQMTALAHQVELEIHDYRPGVVRLLENHGEMEVQFNGQGTYASVCRFLRRTEELPRLCRISRLEIKAPQTGDKTQIDITLLIYFVRPAKANAASGGTARG
ncbi:MAG: type 4a pilus biogenesis protein PilO [Planctomycetia bacterium]|nr:type 4a pilus biogenesis protein PilO [Planctomycetia bacterium]